MSNEINIELDTPVKIADKGDETEINFLSMKAPTGKIAHLCADIKSSFFSAVSKLPTETSGEGKGDKSDITGKDMIQMMYMSGVDMQKVVITAKEVIKAVGLMGGEKVINQTIVDRMSPDDIEKCLGEYMANFILKSALAEMNAD